MRNFDKPNVALPAFAVCNDVLTRAEREAPRYFAVGSVKVPGAFVEEERYFSASRLREDVAQALAWSMAQFAGHGRCYCIPAPGALPVLCGVYVAERQSAVPLWERQRDAAGERP